MCGLPAQKTVPVHSLVEVGDGAGAQVLVAADVDDEVGVGADERQVARPRPLEERPVRLGRFVAIVVEAGAQDGVGRVEVGARGGEPLEGAAVPVGRADAVDGR